MRLYPLADQERMHLQQQVREWTRAGLLTPEQQATCLADLQTPLRRTRLMLRIGLAIFAIIVAAAAMGFVALLVRFSDDGGNAVLLTIGAAGTFVVAEWLVKRFHFYRHGVEEGLLLGAIALGFAAIAFALASLTSWSDDVAFAGAFGVAALASTWCYVRFGLRYAAVLGLLLLTVATVPLNGVSGEVKRVAAAAVCLVACVVNTRANRRVQSEVLKDDTAYIAAAALAVGYAWLNLPWGLVAGFDVRRAVTPAWFWWGTYVMLWTIPVVGLWTAIRARDRMLLRVSLVLTLATLISTKPYLGEPRQTWDPMLLGLLLAGGAVVVRRWLHAGPQHQRGAFTADAVLPEDHRASEMGALASAAVHMQPPSQSTRAPEAPTFSGGRSGGAGAGGTF